MMPSRTQRGALQRVRIIANTLVLVLSCLLAGCGGSAPAVVSPRDVEEYGTAAFTEPRDTVFRACVLALRRSEQRIRVAEPSTGLIVTWPDALAAPSARAAHGYLVEVIGLPDGRVQVVATPTSADEAAAQREVAPPRWELGRERAAWERFFADVQSLIERRRDAPP